MAIPTLTAVSPSSLKPWGAELATITGTGFGPNVRVTFNGVASEWAGPADGGTRVFAVSPPGPASGAVTIVVQNVDANGVDIAGEVVTNALLATWVLPDLSTESPLARLIRTLLQLIKRQVLPATAPDSTAVDYDDTPDDTRVLVLAEAPSVSLGGPLLTPNGFYRDNTLRNTAAGNNTFATLAPSVAYDAAFTVTVCARSKIQALNMQMAIMSMAQRNVRLYMDRVAGDPNTRTGWRMNLGQFRAAAPREGVHVATADLLIVGFTPDDGAVISATRIVEDVEAAVGPLEV